MEKVIDVSQYNGNIDFFKIREAGVKKVIIRVGWIGNRNNHTLDTKFINYMTSAIYAGMEIGIYVYSYCKTIEACKSGMEWVYNNILQYKENIKLGIFLDLEDETISNLGKDELTKHGVEFCEFIKQRGFPAGVYANKFWWTTKLKVEELQNYKIWLAQYANIEKPQVDFRVDLWQYTDKATINGINGYVDMNYCMQCENQENIEEITGEKGGYEMKVYQNGSTIEKVYQDLQCKKQIGYLNPREIAECYAVINSKALIVYNVDGTANKKTGFVKWLGGIK